MRRVPPSASRRPWAVRFAPGWQERRRARRAQRRWRAGRKGAFALSPRPVAHTWSSKRDSVVRFGNSIQAQTRFANHFLSVVRLAVGPHGPAGPNWRHQKRHQKRHRERPNAGQRPFRCAPYGSPRSWVGSGGDGRNRFTRTITENVTENVPMQVNGHLGALHTVRRGPGWVQGATVETGSPELLPQTSPRTPQCRSTGQFR
jgi:hypothetical protein